ncbi:hypothetical protein [Roseimarinus sediminis]|uniref:hypothetical protein n=1 Tax=Roseimarinus sediminis TaxID=1610899 RepID=UPI003D1CDE34
MMTKKKNKHWYLLGLNRFFHVTFLLTGLLLLFFVNHSPAFWKPYHQKIDSFKIVCDSEVLRVPGGSFPIGIIVYQNNGKVKSTIDPRFFNTLWGKFEIDIEGGSYSNGSLFIDETLLPSKGKHVSISINPYGAPKMKQKLILPLNYEEKIQLIPITDVVPTPGYSFRFKMLVSFNNGEELEILNRWNSRFSHLFEFENEGVSIKESRCYIEKDFNKLNKHQISITARPLRNPDISYTYTLAMDYKAEQRFVLGGSDGYHGSNGRDGSDGSSGADGRHGENGRDGGNGDDGPDMGVWVDYYFDSLLAAPMLYVYGENLWTGKSYHFLINTNGGLLHVISHGGSGGTGGRGGDGGDGGDGNAGRWRERTVVLSDSTSKVERWQGRGQDGGDGGDGAYGGYGGNGGDGGNIYVYFTDDAAPYRQLIVPDSNGGWFGTGGFGGSAGSAGDGGQGDPKGRDGSSGNTGSSGNSGDWGSSGTVSYGTVEELVTY